MYTLELQKVYYKQGNFILHDVNLAMEEGSTVALVGRSGSGKTTLLRLIGNAMRPDVGRFLYFGKELYQDEKNIRRYMSVVYNQPNFNVDMRTARVAEEIARFEPWFDMEFFHKYMLDFCISERKRVKELSTGQQKKYMMILALCRQPKLLIADEPTSGLDEKSRDDLWKMIADYRKKNSLTVLFSTHHTNDKEVYADRVLTMENGGLR